MSLIPSPDSPIKEPPPKPPMGPPVRMKMRPDLTFDKQTYQGVEYLVVKEPLGQKYYQFPPQVHYLLTLLDGEITIDQLQDAYHEKYAPKRITRQELQQLLTRFHQDGLVISSMPGQGIELLKRGDKNNRMERFQMLSNILAIRYRGFDPEGILNWLIKWTWWIFTKPMVYLVCVLASIALMSVVVNWGPFQAKLPGFDAFFDPKQWYLFVIVLAVTKMCHEFGHGLSCKHLGGECHEIGFMLLVLTPCLYCNVSDSWRLNNKWHRAAIGAAGMYIEIILATIATFVWWFVQPGLVQDICLRVMLVSSISTVLFNGNPLLRFDGYYILSDILEIPNMGQKSTKALTTLLGRNWLGLEIPDDALMPTNRPWAFASYTVAAFCYRWVIMFSILLFLMRWLEPYGLESLGIGIALFSLIGIVVMPCYKLYRYMSVPGRMHQVKKKRFFSVLFVIGALIAALLLIPFPHMMRCDIVVVPEQMQAVYVKEAGMLEECFVDPGDTVEAGQEIARLRNLELEQQLLEAEGRLRLKQTELGAAREQMIRGFGASQVGTLQAEVDEASALLADLRNRKRELIIRAPIAGTVMETPYQHPAIAIDEDSLVDQQPFLIQKHDNVSAGAGQRFCEVANIDRWKGIILLSEQQVNFIEGGKEARIRLFSRPNETLVSTVNGAVGVTDLSINRNDYELLPGQQQDPRVRENRIPDLISELVPQYDLNRLHYYAEVPLKDSDHSLKIGQSGKVRVACKNRSYGARILWWINQNFRM
jgi:putative peptide zinc metalloprotease protein